ncbi:MAG TPA: WcaI family glycosyltransferase [Methylomirabilota bacterium]|jgi:colanic acid biosynthesis glycosyl transferase WcaI|nr:WcaI family glycosyltransferase [Methylomirabilota bacterium]
MRLLLYGLNFAPEPTGVGKFSGEMAAWLARRGHDVRVVAAPPYYPSWRRDASVALWREELWRGVRVYRAPLYVPQRPTGGTRLAHLLSFAAASLPLAWWQAVGFHPEAVLAVAPTLMTAPGALAAATLARARTWLHVQDFETEAAFGLGIVGGAAVRNAGLGAEGWLLRRFDRVSTISQPMLRRLIDKGVSPERARLVPNWADLEAIRPLAAPSPLRAELGIPPDTLVALYAGTLGTKQGLDILPEAARSLRDAPHILIAIAGEGPARAGLAEATQGLANVALLPLQPPERLNDLLNLADLHLLPERPEAADLVMPSKLGGMLASGRPVVAAVRPDRSAAHGMAGAGTLVPPGDAAALAAAIRALAADPARRAALGAEARRLAERDWNGERILVSLEEDLRRLINVQ